MNSQQHAQYLDIGLQSPAIASTASNSARRQIDLMNEYRTRLIADVVTGQLDVRETAAQLQARLPEAAPMPHLNLIWNEYTLR